MTTNFAEIERIEFFVCLSAGHDERHYQVPVDQSVQEALGEMIQTTKNRIDKQKSNFRDYSPAQKYAADEPVQCSLSSEFAAVPRLLIEGPQVPETSNALDDPKVISYYYVIAFDVKGHKLLGVRRASQFKGILKSKLVSVIDNTMKLLESDTFRLDAEFDYLVFDKMLWAIRPAGFEFTGKLTACVKAAAANSAKEVEDRIPFLDLTSLGYYASSHSRAARHLAAVNARDDLEYISQKSLVNYCKDSNVTLEHSGGKLKPAVGHELHFLQVLDRRIFTVELIQNQKERYETSNRHELK